MIKRLLFLPIALLIWGTASAQFQYTFKDTSTTYTPLSGGTSLNGSLIWDDEILFAPMPFTWTMNGNKTTNFFFLDLSVPGVFADTTDATDINGFFLSDVDIADRGTISGSASKSPITYLTTGSAPNRIFKVEIANAGFFAELDAHSSMNDSVDMQVWVYETSNVVEYHYGPSKITFPGDYYGFGGNGPFVGYAKGIDAVSQSAGDLYFLTGSPAAPTVDSISIPFTTPPTGLSDWPNANKVYRFTPKKSNVGVTTASSNKIAVRIYPTLATTQLKVQYLPLNGETADYQICSLTGAVVSSGRLQSGVQSIDVSAFAAGTYYMQVKAKGASGNYRFMKQ
jgi:hypothetical protein